MDARVSASVQEVLFGFQCAKVRFCRLRPRRIRGKRLLFNSYLTNTVTHDILKKLSLSGKDLDEYSLDTVKMFHEDAQKAGYQL